MPPHAVYIETHLGGGAVMKRKPAALRSTGVDRDARALESFDSASPWLQHTRGETRVQVVRKTTSNPATPRPRCRSLTETEAGRMHPTKSKVRNQAEEDC